MIFHNTQDSVCVGTWSFASEEDICYLKQDLITESWCLKRRFSPSNNNSYRCGCGAWDSTSSLGLEMSWLPARVPSSGSFLTSDKISSEGSWMRERLLVTLNLTCHIIAGMELERIRCTGKEADQVWFLVDMKPSLYAVFCSTKAWLIW